MTTDVIIAGKVRDKLALTDLSEMTTTEIQKHTLQKFSYANNKSWRTNETYYSLQDSSGSFVGYRNTKSGVIVAFQLARWGCGVTKTIHLDGYMTQSLELRTNQNGYGWSRFYSTIMIQDSEVENWDIVQLRVRDIVKPMISDLYIIDGNDSCIQHSLNEVFEVDCLLQKGIKEIPETFTMELDKTPLEMVNAIEEMVI